MGFAELLLVAVGLSMDAFAISICKGLSMRAVTARKALTVGLYFGVSQALMPLIGYAVGSQLAGMIAAFDHWIVCALLGIIGGKMIMESFGREPEERTEAPLTAKHMLPLALATSVDALAAGVSFAFLRVEILPAVSLIGGITLVLSSGGVVVGRLFGRALRSKAELIGGLILVFMGVRILLEHMGT